MSVLSCVFSSTLTLYSLISVLFFVYVFYELYWKRIRLPPGPTPLLIIGNMIDVIRNLSNIDGLFQRYKQQYGGIFTFWMGPVPMVMVCDVDLMRLYFVRNGDTFSGRWRNFITDSMLNGFNGVVQTDGPKWREQRRFSLHVLRDFGFGRAFMEDKIMEEIDRFMKNLDRASDENCGLIEPERHLGVCVGNIINNILFGKTFEYTDPTFIRMQNILDQQSTLVLHPMMGMYLTFPFSIHIPLINRPWRRLMKIRDDFWQFLECQIQEHKTQFEAGTELNDFTFVYMNEMASRRAAGKDLGHFSDLQLKMLLLDLFFAGSETTVTTTKWGLLMLVLHPDIQRRVQEELDHLPPRIELAHRNQLTYLQATINEVIQRVANILPVNLLRTTMEDVEIDGFSYSRGTMVLPQISILLNDPKHFANPQEFNPDRFLDENQNLRRYDAFMPFSIGKRECLGMSLAKMELFLIFANLLRNFEFQPVKDEPLPLKDRIYGLTVSPPKFKCIARRRTNKNNDNVNTVRLCA
ncbi:Unspecific monooxygenase [Aphelenchoides besseyi]|nr:Unspecific monooxygenase [Aphelenchoides besseyi]KAI6211526.1 Unspecific monooxygenase [Aphelenchoides besseyi]